MQSVESQATLWKNMSPPSSRLKSKSRKKPASMQQAVLIFNLGTPGIEVLESTWFMKHYEITIPLPKVHTASEIYNC
jgi:hypothetical protein